MIYNMPTDENTWNRTIWTERSFQGRNEGFIPSIEESRSAVKSGRFPICSVVAMSNLGLDSNLTHLVGPSVRLSNRKTYVFIVASHHFLSTAFIFSLSPDCCVSPRHPSGLIPRPTCSRKSHGIYQSLNAHSCCKSIVGRFHKVGFSCLSRQC